MRASRWLDGRIGERVLCSLDNPDRRVEGTLVEIRASGPRVRLDGESRDRTVAEWRIRLLANRPGQTPPSTQEGS